MLRQQEFVGTYMQLTLVDSGLFSTEFVPGGNDLWTSLHMVESLLTTCITP